MLVHMVIVFTFLFFNSSVLDWSCYFFCYKLFLFLFWCFLSGFFATNWLCIWFSFFLHWTVHGPRCPHSVPCVNFVFVSCFTTGAEAKASGSPPLIVVVFDTVLGGWLFEFPAAVVIPSPSWVRFVSFHSVVAPSGYIPPPPWSANPHLF